MNLEDVYQSQTLFFKSDMWPKLAVRVAYANEKNVLSAKNYAVIALPCTDIRKTTKLLSELQKNFPHAQKIVAMEHPDAEKLHEIYKTKAEHILFSSFKLDNLGQVLNTAYRRVHAFNLKNKTKNGKADSKKASAQKRKKMASLQVEALHHALMAIHAAQSIAEIETLVYSALADAMELSWVRVFLYASEHFEEQLNRIQGQAMFKESLWLGSRDLGRIVFARKHKKAFSKSEKESFKQITESVALALDRLAKLEQDETLKLQWDSTFDAISEPLCLTDEKFQILRTNRAFLQLTELSAAFVKGRNCFSIFCGENAPTQVAPSPNALILQRMSSHMTSMSSFEVTTQRIRVQDDAPPILLVLFRNITEQKKIEKQIFESSKMAELGTIGSSIAHEINNPLAGVLSFLQLIKMDLSKEDPLREDILQMEAAGKRCKEIVENLLRFSRRQETQSAEKIDLNEVIQQAFKIIELQTRSLGIAVEFRGSKIHPTISGHFNLLSQALSNILQNAFDAVAEKLTLTPGYKGLIQIELVASKDKKRGPENPKNSAVSILIMDNGVGISPELQNKILNPLFSTKRQSKNQGLGLTLAYQIIDEHKGRLEISSQPNVGTTVKISFLDV